MFGGKLGIPELLLIGVIVLFPICWWKIFAKAGYPGALGLAMLVPLVNFALFLWLAFGSWPVLEELEVRRAQVSALPTDEKF